MRPASDPPYIRAQGRGWTITVPAVALSAVCAWGATYLAQGPSQPASAHSAAEWAELRRDLETIRTDVRVVRAMLEIETSAARTSTGAITTRLDSLEAQMRRRER